MYLQHYGLAEPPFSITPDPRFVFLGERHRDALAHLLFGITQGGGGGFVQLTGEVGTGKTTLSRLLLGQLPANVRVALVLNPRQDPVQLLETVCEELRIDIDGRRGNAKALVDALNARLLEAYAEGLRVVLIIDEAQALPVETLEQVRLLTNLETDTQKLLQIILIGQPELRDLLAQPRLRQLAQRITARFHLTPLDAGGTAEYLRHRFRVAGGQHFPFDAGAVQRIHLRSGGIPRLVNVIAERALLAGYARDRAVIDAALVEEAAREALPPPREARRWRKRWLALAAATGALGVAAVAGALWPRGEPLKEQAEASAEAPVVAPAPAGAGTAGGQSAPVTGAPLPREDATTPRQAVEGAEGLAGRIAAASGGRGEQAAWAALLQAWELPHGEADVRAARACSPALATGTYCVGGTTNIDRLASIGRPALLALEGEGAVASALLQGFDGQRARLLLGDDAIDVERAVLQGAWTGRYAAVWRTAEDVALIPAPARGGSGAGVDWLRERLVREGVAAAAATGTPYDAALAGSVRRFQRARGLAVDGVVGPETLFALATADPGPRLARTLD